jgi:hypothetical protein
MNILRITSVLLSSRKETVVNVHILDSSYRQQSMGFEMLCPLYEHVRTTLAYCPTGGNLQEISNSLVAVNWLQSTGFETL